MNNSKTFLGTEPVGSLLLRLALPTVAAQIINMLYNIVDRIYIGHIPGEGALALTGVGVCMPLIMIVSAFASLVGHGGAPRASIFMGKNNYPMAETILGNCLSLLIILSLGLTAVLLLFNRPLLLAFGASENTIDYAVSYMNIYACTLWLLVELFPGFFAGIFTSDPALIEFSKKALRIYMAGLFLFGVQMACQMTFNSLGNARAAIIVAVVRKFVLLIPLIYVMPLIFSSSSQMQTTAIYMAEPIADFIAVTFTAVLFFFQFKKSLAALDKNVV